MKQKFSLKSLFVAFVALGLVFTTVTSCKNHDDDIKKLRSDIDGIKNDLKGIDQIRQQIGALKYVTSVKEENGKVVFTFNDASVVSVDKSNGAQGPTGPTGPKGPKGDDGKDGKDAITKYEKKGDEYHITLSTGDVLIVPASSASAVVATTLSSMVLLPENVSIAGGALPVFMFNQLDTDDCGYKLKDLYVQYVLNPSTVTEQNIDKDNITVRYNDPNAVISRTSTVDQKAEFVKIDKGILTVKVSVDLQKTWLANYNSANPSFDELRIDELMLEVRNSDGLKVSSDWATLAYSTDKPAIVKIPRDDATLSWAVYEARNYAVLNNVPAGSTGSTTDGTINHFNDASTVDATNAYTDIKSHTLVKFAYNQDLDLLQHVKAMRHDREYSRSLLSLLTGTVLNPNDPNWYDLVLADYDLHFEFDLMNHVTNSKIVYKLGVNNTDQQEFIKFKDAGTTQHVVNTKVYGKPDGNKAAVDRTPIVHVMLKDASGCVVRHGYLKLLITDFIPVVDPIVYEDDLVAKCGIHEATRLGTKEMNEDIYYVVNSSKDKFHVENNGDYTFVQVPHTADPLNVGKIEQVVDPQDTQSFNLVYRLTEQEVYDNICNKVYADAYYEDSKGSKIKIRMYANIVRETINLDLTLDDYWYGEDTTVKAGYKSIVHNVAVPYLGAVNPVECDWYNNISSAFKTIVQTQYDVATDYGVGVVLLDLPSQSNDYIGYEYEYVFDAEQPAYTAISGVSLKPDASGKILLASKGGPFVPIAEIHPQVAGPTTVGAPIDYDTDGDILELYENSVLGKELLNAGPEALKAKLRLVAYNTCHRDKTKDYREVNVRVKNLDERQVRCETKQDRFDVIFVRPLNIQNVSDEVFVDAVDFGAIGSWIDVMKVAELEDWRNYVKNVTTYNFIDNPNYFDYYDVQSMVIDVNNITVEGLTVSGQPQTVKPNTIVIKQTAAGEQFQIDPNDPSTLTTFRFGRLTYKNNGANINDPFTLVVPVTVTYKWGSVSLGNVKVVVKPSASTPRN